MKVPKAGAKSGSDDQEAVVVHRCKFVDYKGSGIIQISVDHSERQLACCRKNGDIEIWKREKNKWFCQKYLNGLKNVEVTSIFWARESSESGSRLFTCNTLGEIMEWDLIKLRPACKWEFGGGAIYSSCINPRNESQIAICSEDSRVRILNLTQGLELLKTTGATTTRVCSIDWDPTENLIICGGDNSNLSVIDPLGNVVDSIYISSPKDKVVMWAVKCLKNQWFVTGDSSGMVTFWDKKTHTAVFSSQAHDADVLCLESCSDTEVWSAGADCRVVNHKLISTDGKSSSKSWKLIGKKKYHSHDINSIRVLEHEDTIVTGGTDSSLVFSTPASKFPNTKPYRNPCYPHRSIIEIIPEFRLILAQYQDRIKLWQLEDNSIGDFLDKPTLFKMEDLQEKLILELKPQASSTLTASTISPDSQVIAISDIKSTRLYKFDLNKALCANKKSLFGIKSHISLPSANALIFVEPRVLVAGSNSSLCVIDIAEDLTLTIRSVIQIPSYESEPSIVTSLCASADKSWIACGCSNNTIHTFKNLEYHWQINMLDSFHTSISFHSKLNHLIVSLVSNEFCIYDCAAKKLTNWSSKNLRSMPPKWINRKEIIMGSASIPNTNTLILYGPSYCCFIKTDTDIKLEQDVILSSMKLAIKRFSENGQLKSKKRIIENSTSHNSNHLSCANSDKSRISENLHLEHRYSPIMKVGHLSENEIVVVEHPVLKFIDSLPPGFWKHSFGT